MQDLNVGEGEKNVDDLLNGCHSKERRKEEKGLKRKVVLWMP